MGCAPGPRRAPDARSIPAPGLGPSQAFPTLPTPRAQVGVRSVPLSPYLPRLFVPNGPAGAALPVPSLSPCPEQRRILGSRCSVTSGPLAPSETSDPAGPRNIRDARQDPARDAPGFRDPEPLPPGRIL